MGENGEEKNEHSFLKYAKQITSSKHIEIFKILSHQRSFISIIVKHRMGIVTYIYFLGLIKDYNNWIQTNIYNQLHVEQ